MKTIELNKVEENAVYHALVTQRVAYRRELRLYKEEYLKEDIEYLKEQIKQLGIVLKQLNKDFVE